MGCAFSGTKSPVVKPIYLRSSSTVEQKMIDGARLRRERLTKSEKEITVSRAPPNIANIRISKRHSALRDRFTPGNKSKATPESTSKTPAEAKFICETLANHWLFEETTPKAMAVIVRHMYRQNATAGETINMANPGETRNKTPFTADNP